MSPAPPLGHNVTGPGQMLGVAGAAVDRLYTLGFLHRYCNGSNSSWAARAALEMRVIAAFPDWNPQHFLDTVLADVDINLLRILPVSPFASVVSRRSDLCCKLPM